MEGQFSNPHVLKPRRTVRDFFLWKMGYYDDPADPISPPPDFRYPIPNKKVDSSEPGVTWVNHSTFLINIDGFHLLTDPIWSPRCSPLPFLGPKRRHPPGIRLEDLPEIDLILISHNHYDHLDKKSVLTLFHRFPKIFWIVPQKVKKWFEKLGIHRVIELSWWQQTSIDTSHFSALKVTATPAQHFSGRGACDANRSLWAGYVLEFERKKGEDKRLYFVGDTGYNPSDFKSIGSRWQGMDLSLIPIGSYVPRLFMSPVHIEPKDAVKIHREVNSKLSIGMHWKTFLLSDEPPELPPYDLFLSLKQEGLDPLQFLVIEPGHALNW